MTALRVWVASWQLEEDRSVVAVGDTVSPWLDFTEADRWPMPAERVQSVRGVARPLPMWDGAELGRHAVRLDVGQAALYWDGPAPIDPGPIEIAGHVSWNDIAAPQEFPTTRGIVRGVRMERREYARDGVAWVPADATAR